ncbi:MAG: hypothetical protein RIQ53_3645 [Pseudomonadota bacterium]
MAAPHATPSAPLSTAGTAPASHGLWAASAPPAPPAGPLTADLSGAQAVDVVIIGGGYTGCSAALHLAEGGARVALLEARALGHGGAGRNVGLVNAGLWVMPEVLPQVLGPVHGPRLLQLLGDGPRTVFELIARHGIACEAVHRGTLHCAVGASGLTELHQRARQWQALGAPVTVLDAARTAERTGTPAYAGSLLDLRAGTVQPLAYVRGLAAAAQRAGAQLYVGSRAVRAEATGTAQQPGWCLHTDTGGRVQARWVLVATDAYTGEHGLWPALQTEQVSLPYFNLATEPLTPRQAAGLLPGGEGAWDTRQVLTSFRMDAAGRLVFGSVGALQGSGRAVHTAWARRAMARLFPQLRGVALQHAWHGTIGMTHDAIPRLHTLAPQVLAVAGYNGRGISPGTVMGRALARHILGLDAPDALPLPFSTPEPERWRTLRTAGYEAGAQAQHLVDARW